MALAVPRVLNGKIRVVASKIEKEQTIRNSDEQYIADLETRDSSFSTVGDSALLFRRIADALTPDDGSDSYTISVPPAMVKWLQRYASIIRLETAKANPPSIQQVIILLLKRIKKSFDEKDAASLGERFPGEYSDENLIDHVRESFEVTENFPPNRARPFTIRFDRELATWLARVALDLKIIKFKKDVANVSLQRAAIVLLDELMNSYPEPVALPPAYGNKYFD